MPEPSPPPTGIKARLNEVKKDLSTLRTAFRHRGKIGEGIQIAKKTKKLTIRLREGVVRARQEVVRAGTNYMTFYLRLVGYICEKIAWALGTAIAVDQDEYDVEPIV